MRRVNTSFDDCHMLPLTNMTSHWYATVIIKVSALMPQMQTCGRLSMQWMSLWNLIVRWHAHRAMFHHNLYSDVWLQVFCVRNINTSRRILKNMWPRGVHCDNIRKQRARKYMVIYIHKRKNLEFT